MNKSKYSPLPGFIVLSPLEEEKIGNFTVSENMSSKDSAGIVIAVGAPWTYREGSQTISMPCPVKVGDKVIYKNITGQRYLDFESGKWVYIVKWHDDPVWSDIICVIN